MSKSHKNVLIFGASGAVGRAAVTEAIKRGATVWLAMRDPGKAIPGLSDTAEKEGRAHRIKADLTDNESIKAAVEQSKATAAFLYAVRTQDGMASVAQTLKAAGITSVVFLSSFTIRPSDTSASLDPAEMIPYYHLKIEESIKGSGFESVTCLRPGSFASNILSHWFDRSKQPWEATLPDGSDPKDRIVPLDIGRVAAAQLVAAPAGEQTIYLKGPELLSDEDAYAIVSKEFGVDVKLNKLDQEAFRKQIIASGTSAPIANYIARQSYYVLSLYEGIPGIDTNVQTYSGYKPTTFTEYLQSVKSEYV